MADFIVRGLSEEVHASLKQKAAASEKSANEYVRDLLERVAAEPVIKERYALRFYADEGTAKGKLVRYSDHVNGVGGGYSVDTQEQGNAVQRAKDLMRQNAPGDREEAIFLLKTHFNNVFEVPV